VKIISVNQTGGDTLLTSTKLSFYPGGLVRTFAVRGEQPIGKSSSPAEQMTGGISGFARQTIQAAMVSPS
jgi:hypothetical protein